MLGRGGIRMEKEILKQYISLINEIRDEEERIHKLEKEIDSMNPIKREVTDVVTKGKRGKKPLGTYTIRGNEDNTSINRKRRQLRERKAKKELHVVHLDDMVIDAEEYIYNMEESELRRILMFFCIDRKTWQEVAKSMGEGYTAEQCKQKFSRFMRVK